MRRTPAATPLSPTIVKNPMSPIAPGGVAHVDVDRRGHEIAYSESASGHAHAVSARPTLANARKAFHAGRCAGRVVDDLADVGHLAARLDVERRLRQREVAALSV